MRLSRNLVALMAVAALAPMASAQSPSVSNQGCTAAQNSANALYGYGYRAYIRIANNVADFSCNLSGTAYGTVTLASAQSFTFTNGMSAAIGNLSFITTPTTYGYTVPTSQGSNTNVTYGLTANLGTVANTQNFVFAFAGPVTPANYNLRSSTLAATITNPGGIDPRISKTVTGQNTQTPVAVGEDGSAIPTYVVAPPNTTNGAFMCGSGGGTCTSATASDSGRYSVTYGGNGNYNTRLNMIGNGSCNTSTANAEVEPPNACGFGTQPRTNILALSQFNNEVSFTLERGTWTEVEGPCARQNADPEALCYTSAAGGSAGVNIQTSWSGQLVFEEVDPTPLQESPVPEPASLVLLGIGLFAVAGIARRRRNAAK